MKFNILVTPDYFDNKKIPGWLRILALGSYPLFAQETGPQFSKILNIAFLLCWLGFTLLLLVAISLYFFIPNYLWNEFYVFDNFFFNIFRNDWNPFYQVAEGLSSKNTLFDRYKYYGLTAVLMSICALFVVINLTILILSSFGVREKVRFNFKLEKDSLALRLHRPGFAKNVWVVLQSIFICFCIFNSVYLGMYLVGYLSESNPKRIIYAWFEIMLLPIAVIQILACFLEVLTMLVSLLLSLFRLFSVRTGSPFS